VLDRVPKQFSPRADERDGPGDHWVTIDGHHVLIHESQGKPQSAAPPAQDRVTILGKSVAVTYASGVSDKQRDAALAAIKSAAALLDENASKLSDKEKRSIANIKTIDVDPTASRSSIDALTGTFHANAGQLAESTARLATDIAHDSFHIMQWKSGRAYTGGPAEREAAYFQIGIGEKIGLSKEQIDTLKNYADHIENYKDYWHSPITHHPTSRAVPIGQNIGGRP
jgi:hypothetical protein